MATMISKQRVFAQLDVRLTRIDGELNLLKWMSGIIIAGVASLVVKTFFS